MFKIEGLDKLSKDLEEASRALEALGGTIGEVRFDPDDPASIEIAIVSINALIDERASGFETNPLIQPLIEEMKESYRAALLEKAAEARLEGNSDDE